MASRLFAPASSERVDNSGSLRGSGPQTDESADNEPTKRRSSSLVGDLAASILGADVLAARKAPPFPDDADVNDLEAPGRPPTPPWRARAPARNMSVAGVSGIN